MTKAKKKRAEVGSSYSKRAQPAPIVGWHLALHAIYGLSVAASGVARETPARLMPKWCCSGMYV